MLRICGSHMYNMAAFYLRYLLATLNANEGSKIKTFTHNNLITIWCKTDASLSGPVNIKRMPITPKEIDEMINIRVAIFCIIFLLIKTY